MRLPCVMTPERWTLEDSKWQARYKQLQPIRVCARVEGETAPYPSCMK